MWTEDEIRSMEAEAKKRGVDFLEVMFEAEEGFRQTYGGTSRWGETCDRCYDNQRERGEHASCPYENRDECPTIMSANDNVLS